MPFITKERREMIMNGTITELEPGDLCYCHYKRMVERWRANPRWATAHSIYEAMITLLNYNKFPLDIDDKLKCWIIEDEAAMQLAWQVFFIKYIIPYENQKEIENGDI